MSELPTPETDAFILSQDYSPTGHQWRNFTRKLERERDDYTWRCRVALGERDNWRMRAEQKYSMRKELEELLGVDSNSASDEQFMKGLDSLKKIIRERDEAREALRELWQTADAYIPQIDEEQTTKWHNAMFGNSKNG